MKQNCLLRPTRWSSMVRLHSVASWCWNLCLFCMSFVQNVVCIILRVLQNKGDVDVCVHHGERGGMLTHIHTHTCTHTVLVWGTVDSFYSWVKCICNLLSFFFFFFFFWGVFVFFVVIENLFYLIWSYLIVIENLSCFIWSFLILVIVIENLFYFIWSFLIVIKNLFYMVV